MRKYFFALSSIFLTGILLMLNQEKYPDKSKRFGLEQSKFWEIRNSSNFVVQSDLVSFNRQVTTITLNAANLQDPHILKVHINPAYNQVKGLININNQQTIQLNNQDNSVDLSPYLVWGENIIDISSEYIAKNTQISVEFSGSGNNVSQQSSGDGSLRHTLIIYVE